MFSRLVVGIGMTTEDYAAHARHHWCAFEPQSITQIARGRHVVLRKHLSRHLADVLAKAIDAPVEISKDHERHQFPRSLVDPCLERWALRRQGHTVGIGRVLEAAAVAPGFEVDTEQAKQLPVLLQEDLGAPSDLRPSAASITPRSGTSRLLTASNTPRGTAKPV
jgi:hypothetical protein